MNPSATSIWPVLLRIVVGASWLLAGISKVIDPAYAASSLAPALTHWATLAGPIAAFVRDYLVPNVGLLAFTIKLAELLIGAALLLGFLTRLAAFAGFLVFAAAWAIQSAFLTLGGYGVGSLVGMVTMLYLVFASSGHTLAIDAIRAARPRPQVIHAASPPSPPTSTAPVSPQSSDNPA